MTDDKELIGIIGSESAVVGVISDQSNLHSSYIGVPFYYRLELGKLGIKTGVQSMFFLFASSNYKASGEIDLFGQGALEGERSDMLLPRVDKVGT